MALRRRRTKAGNSEHRNEAPRRNSKDEQAARTSTHKQATRESAPRIQDTSSRSKAATETQRRRRQVEHSDPTNTSANGQHRRDQHKRSLAALFIVLYTLGQYCSATPLSTTNPKTLADLQRALPDTPYRHYNPTLSLPQPHPARRQPPSLTIYDRKQPPLPSIRDPKKTPTPTTRYSKSPTPLPPSRRAPWPPPLHRKRPAAPQPRTQHHERTHNNIQDLNSDPNTQRYSQTLKLPHNKHIQSIAPRPHTAHTNSQLPQHHEYHTPHKSTIQTCTHKIIHVSKRSQLAPVKKHSQPPDRLILTSEPEECSLTKTTEVGRGHTSTPTGISPSSAEPHQRHQPHTKPHNMWHHRTKTPPSDPKGALEPDQHQHSTRHIHTLPQQTTTPITHTMRAPRQTNHKAIPYPKTAHPHTPQRKNHKLIPLKARANVNIPLTHPTTANQMTIRGKQNTYDTNPPPIHQTPLPKKSHTAHKGPNLPSAVSPIHTPTHSQYAAPPETTITQNRHPQSNNTLLKLPSNPPYNTHSSKRAHTPKHMLPPPSTTHPSLPSSPPAPHSHHTATQPQQQRRMHEDYQPIKNAAHNTKKQSAPMHTYTR